MKPALIYVRETAGESVMEQIERCRAYAAALEYQALAAFVDLQVPGPAYRIALRGVMDMIEAGDIEAVIAPSAGTISKDPARLDAIREDLSAKRCVLHVVFGPS